MKAYIKLLGGMVHTKNGLLYRDDQVIKLPLADVVAAEYGFQHAEQLVKYLENTMHKNEPILADTTYLRYLNRAIGQLPMGPERDAIERQFIAALIWLRGKG